MGEPSASRILYNPSLIGRVARAVLPALRRTLPRPAYERLYRSLYRIYSVFLRASYITRWAATAVSGGRADRLRARLTYKLLPYTMGGRVALESAFDLVKQVEERGVEGALVECGVARGGTAAMMALASQEIGGPGREKWLFDSFEGLPDPTEKDYENGRAGEYIRPLGRGACLGTLEEVSELLLVKLAIPAKEVHLVKGWFQDTIPGTRQSIGKVAVLRLDGDWYESTRVPLDELYWSVEVGGVVIVDDYATCYGSRRAVDEFLTDHNLEVDLKPDGRGGAFFFKDGRPPRAKAD